MSAKRKKTRKKKPRKLKAIKKSGRAKLRVHDSTPLKERGSIRKSNKPRAATPPAMGERRAIGGILPQYEAFARFAYAAILDDELVWIKIADPQAGKLDDIQYATANEVRAYQVKWSGKSKPTPFKFSEFKELLPAFVSAWKGLRQVNKDSGKRIVVNLLTNRPLSRKDSIRIGKKKVGSFFSFHQEFWIQLTTNGSVSVKWRKLYEILLRSSGLKEKEFRAFANDCILTFDYSPVELNVDLHHATREFDLNAFVKFLFKTVAASGRPV